MADRDVDEIILELHGMIQRIHQRPAIYVGDESLPGAPEALDAVLFYAHRSWAFAQRRDDDFAKSLSATREQHGCETHGFAQTFRMTSSDPDRYTHISYVLACWRSVGDRMGMERAYDVFGSRAAIQDGG